VLAFLEEAVSPMSIWAGFAVVAEVTESAVNQTLRIYHGADLFPNSITGGRYSPVPSEGARLRSIR
jgi:hypothetical protein